MPEVAIVLWFLAGWVVLGWATWVAVRWALELGERAWRFWRDR